ncbi:hypothetical protein [Methanoculleus chikugoensis]|uniref:hypothetical protein n=1 Tax=Methanoculleus chikugoensis TaxID=118126 RepID=UPI001FB567C7|nr:hypothetical protein [Methanoculleus chikugoensis]
MIMATRWRITHNSPVHSRIYRRRDDLLHPSPGCSHEGEHRHHDNSPYMVVHTSSSILPTLHAAAKAPQVRSEGRFASARNLDGQVEETFQGGEYDRRSP